MFKPSPVLSARLRLTTKQVNGGYYKGNRTGSMGAHTEYGGYIIDYRKTRHYKMPNLTNFDLTPFVTKEMEPTKWERTDKYDKTREPSKVDGMDLLRTWKSQRRDEYEWTVQYQEEQAQIRQRVTAAQKQSHEQVLVESPVHMHSASETKTKEHDVDDTLNEEKRP
jgi:large subunit ribosomal protein L41